MPHPSSKRSVGTLLSAVLLCTVSFMACANEWGVVSGDRTTISSHCIGSNATAACLADTAMACGAWSEGADYTGGEGYESDPLCLKPFLDGLGVEVRPFAPARFMIHYYFVEFWQLSQQDMDQAPPYLRDKWQTGDTVADFYVLTCTPQTYCLDGRPVREDTEITLGHCPRTRCYGEPDMYHSDWIGADVALPTVTLVFHQESTGWQIVNWYNVGSAPKTEPPWVPNRWKRQQ